MTNGELIEALANCSGLTKAQVKRVLECTQSVIVNEVSTGGAVTLPGVVKLQARERPARMVRNPATGEQIARDADLVVKATIAKNLKDSVNQ